MGDSAMESSNPGYLRRPLPSRAALSLILLFILCGLSPPSRIRSQEPGVPAAPNRRMVGGESPFRDPVEERKRFRMLNVDRQKNIVADTEKLLKLARELNQETESETAQAPTVAQMRKLAEIEKLAHNVKDKMTNALGGPSTNFNDPYSVVNR